MSAAAKPAVLNLDALSEQDFASVVAELQRLRTERAQLVDALRDILGSSEPVLHPKWIDTSAGQECLAGLRAARALLHSLGEST